MSQIKKTTNVEDLRKNPNILNKVSGLVERGSNYPPTIEDETYEPSHEVIDYFDDKYARLRDEKNARNLPKIADTKLEVPIETIASVGTKYKDIDATYTIVDIDRENNYIIEKKVRHGGPTSQMKISLEDLETFKQDKEEGEHPNTLDDTHHIISEKDLAPLRTEPATDPIHYTYTVPNTVDMGDLDLIPSGGTTLVLTPTFKRATTETFVPLHKDIENFLKEGKNLERVLKILNKENLTLGTHGKEYENRETGEVTFIDESDLDGQLTAFLLKQAGLKVSKENFVAKGVKNVETLGDDKKADIYFDTAEEGHVMRIGTYPDGSEYLVFGNHYSGRTEKSSSAQICQIILEKTKKLNPELRKPYIRNFINFVNNADNLIIPGSLEKKFATEHFANVISRSLYGQYRNLPFDTILEHFKEGKTDNDDLDDKVLNEETTNDKTGETKKRKDWMYGNALGTIKGMKKAEQEMEEKGYRAELPELGRILVNENKTSKTSMRDILGYFGFDATITFSEKGVFISKPTCNIEETLGKRLQEKFGEEVVLVNSMILYYPKDKPFDKEAFIEELGLINPNSVPKKNTVVDDEPEELKELKSKKEELVKVFAGEIERLEKIQEEISRKITAGTATIDDKIEFEKNKEKIRNERAQMEDILEAKGGIEEKLKSGIEAYSESIKQKLEKELRWPKYIIYALPEKEIAKINNENITHTLAGEEKYIEEYEDKIRENDLKIMARIEELERQIAVSEARIISLENENKEIEKILSIESTDEPDEKTKEDVVEPEPEKIEEKEEEIKITKEELKDAILSVLLDNPKVKEKKPLMKSFEINTLGEKLLLSGEIVLEKTGNFLFPTVTIEFSSDLVNKDGSIKLINYVIDAEVATSQVKKILEPQLGNLSKSIKAYFEKTTSKKIKTMKIENGILLLETE